MKLTVLLLPEGSAGASVLLRELSEKGMLRTCVVVKVGGNAAAVEAGIETRVDLAEYLAARQLELVRIIHLSIDGLAITDEMAAIAGEVKDNLTPVGVAVETSSICLPLHGGSVEAGVFPPFWNHNLYVQPVDMAGEEGFGILPLVDPEKQLVIAVAAAALCGALWMWLDEGPLDGGRFREAEGVVAPFDGGVHGAKVRLVRAVTRMVDAGDVAAQSVGMALRPGVQFPPPPGCGRHGDPRSAVTELEELIFPKAGGSPLGMAFVPHAPGSSDGRRVLSPLQALKAFFSELLNELRRIPREMIENRIAKAKKWVEQVVTNNTFGEDSMIRVTFESSPSADIALDGGKRSEEVLKLSAIEAPGATPSPSTWTGLAAIVISAADGAELPAGMAAGTALQWNQQPAVLSDYSVLAHTSIPDTGRGQFVLTPKELSALGWDPNTPTSLLACDTWGARAVQARLRLLSASPPPPAAEESTEESVETPAPSAAALKTLAELGERLDVWIEERKPTLLWRVSERLVREQDAAFQSLTTAVSELQRVLTEMDEMEETERKNRRWFRRRALLILLWLVLCIGVGVAGLILLAMVSMWIWIGVMAFGLVSAAKMMVGVAAERVRQKYRRDDLLLRPGRLMDQRQTAAREYVRLSSLYGQFHDWVEILATALHRPLGHSELSGSAPWESTVEALSFVSGKPSLDQTKVRASTLSVMQQLASRGWLTSAFRRQRAMVIEDYLSAAGGVAAAEHSPESDNSADGNVLARIPGVEDSDVYPPRMNLRMKYADGRFALRDRRAQVEVMQDAVAASNPLGMIETISCDIVGLNTPPRNPTQFLNPVVEWSGRPDFRSMLDPKHQVNGVDVKSIVGISDGLGANLLPQRSATIPVMPVPRRTTLAAFRIDVSDAVSLTAVPSIVGGQDDGSVIIPSPTPTVEEHGFG